MKTSWSRLVISCVVLAVIVPLCSAITTRCFLCNSRGQLGDCKDPFTHNSTSFRDLPGKPVGVLSCPSGWCRKQMEIVIGPNKHGIATERHCLQIPPPDNEERCAKVTIQNKPTLLCFCRGDLCNSAQRLGTKSATERMTLIAISVITIKLTSLFLS